MRSREERKRKDLQTYSLLFFLVSLFGWVFETVLCWLQNGEFCDRGFLSLPLCPIYGAPVTLIYYFFGRPSDGLFYRLMDRKKSKREGKGRFLRKTLSVSAYFLAAGAIATIAELAVGVSLKWAGLSLWSYSGVPLCFMEVVCLPVSLAWGGLITLFAQFVLPPITRWLVKIPKAWKRVLNALLWTALLADFAYNAAYYFINSQRLEFSFGTINDRLLRGNGL